MHLKLMTHVKSRRNCRITRMDPSPDPYEYLHFTAAAAHLHLRADHTYRVHTNILIGEKNVNANSRGTVTPLQVYYVHLYVDYTYVYTRTHSRTGRKVLGVVIYLRRRLRRENCVVVGNSIREGRIGGRVENTLRRAFAAACGEKLV